MERVYLSKYRVHVFSAYLAKSTFGIRYDGMTQIFLNSLNLQFKNKYLNIEIII